MPTSDDNTYGLRDEAFGPGGNESAMPVQPLDAVPAAEPVDPVDEILADPLIAEALESAQPSKIHAALRAKRDASADPDEIALIDELLASRRLLVQPIRSAPTMSTVNGIGAKLYGRSDYSPSDGTYIATHWFTVLFLPIFPLRQYLVRYDGGNLYSFLGKLPPARWLKVYRRGFMSVAAALAVMVGLLAWNAMNHADVHFVNGLDIAVSVEAGDKVFDVPAGKRVTREFETGELTIAVHAPDGRTIETETVTVDNAPDALVYNIAGAAPVYLERIEYIPDHRITPEHAEKENEYDHFAGRRWISINRCNYVFKDAPEEIRMSQTTRSEIREHLDVFDSCHWSMTIALLDDEGRDADAAELARTVAAAEPGEATALAEAAWRTSAEKDDAAALAFLNRLLETAPDQLAVHRLRLNYMTTLAAESEYRRLARENPDSPTYQLLAAGLDARDPKGDRFAALADRFAEDVPIRLAFGRDLVHAGRHGDAVAQFEKVHALDPAAMDSGDIYYYAHALAARGRQADAYAWVDDYCTRHPDRVGWELAELFAHLHQLQPAGEGSGGYDKHFRPLFNGRKPPAVSRYLFDALLGRQVPASAIDRDVELPQDRRVVQLAVHARHNLRAALDMSASLDDELLWQVDNVTLLLLGLEQARRGRTDLAGRMFTGTGLDDAQCKALREFGITGKWQPELDDLPPVSQAVLHLHAGRRRAVAGKSPDDDYRRARANDPIGVVVPHILANWPAP